MNAVPTSRVTLHVVKSPANGFGNNAEHNSKFRIQNYYHFSTLTSAPSVKRL